MDASITNLWRCWKLFRHGKGKAAEIDEFEYHLEINLSSLSRDILSGAYRHSQYRHFTVYENKKRDIAVASVRDRVVHRLVYEYLIPLFDKIFIFDVWSCRKNKGLLGAIVRSQDLMRRYRNAVVWRADVEKFFDNVNHDILLSLVSRKVSDKKMFSLIKEIVGSYSVFCERERKSKSGTGKTGIPIGNLTSQIFSNIYINEFDRFVVHNLKPRAYIRYGDDFVMFARDQTEAESFRNKGKAFLGNNLRLSLHRKNDVIIKACRGIHFLGLKFFRSGGDYAGGCSAKFSGNSRRAI